jgi:acetylornithine deacetylase/succinyl-diaminopimelate desuccinylase-like protein
MAQAHQPDEFVALPALAAAEQIYYRLARRVLR